MAIFKFYQINRSLKGVLGEEGALKLFPEYPTLPDKMPAIEQVQLASTLMDRIDKELDKDTVMKIRQRHCCNPSKAQVSKISELKAMELNLEEFCVEYSKFLSPGHVKKVENIVTLSFGLEKCVCGMFRKLDKYEPISKTWCECCNGHVIKTFSLICDKSVKSEIVEAIACGGQDCIFKIVI